MARLTDRDLEYLAGICRWPFITVPQLQEWTDGTRSGATLSGVYKRIRGLESRGFIIRDRVMHSAPAFVSATREGMQAIGVEGKVASARFSQFRHDLDLVDLALRVRRARPDLTLVTEREMRAEDTQNQHRHHDPVWAVPRIVGDSGRGRLFPDLVQTKGGRRVIHELELTPKVANRLAAIMRAYVTDERVGSIRYYAGPNAHDRVSTVAADVNEWAATEQYPVRVTVLQWPWNPEEAL